MEKEIRKEVMAYKLKKRDGIDLSLNVRLVVISTYDEVYDAVRMSIEDEYLKCSESTEGYVKRTIDTMKASADKMLPGIKNDEITELQTFLDTSIDHILKEPNLLIFYEYLDILQEKEHEICVTQFETAEAIKRKIISEMITYKDLSLEVNQEVNTFIVLGLTFVVLILNSRLTCPPHNVIEQLRVYLRLCNRPSTIFSIRANQSRRFFVTFT